MITYHCIESFLAVVNTGSISKAAEYLFTSQSNVSKWLRTLETELGAQVVTRNRGQRTVELTSQGKDLVPLAEEWLALRRQIEGIGKNFRPGIRILAVDSLNSTLLPPVYHQLLHTFPNLEMTVSTSNSNTIYREVERKKCDLGIVLMEQHSPNLVITPFLKQSFQLLVYQERGDARPGPVSPAELDVQRNLYLPSGLVYQQWHDYWWHCASYIRVDTVSTAKALFREDGLWTIVPQCVAEHFRDDPHVRFPPLDPAPPLRTCYLVTHKYPRSACKPVLESVKGLLRL